MDEIGPQIRRLRKAKNWSVAQLAVYAGMSPSAVSQIETGRRSPTATSMTKLAKALEVEVQDLFPKAQPRLLPEAPQPSSEQQEFAERLIAGGVSESTARSVAGLDSRSNEYWAALARAEGLESSFNDGVAEERRLRYLRTLRAILGDLFIQWTEEPPEKTAEVQPLVNAMKRIVEEGVGDTTGVTDQSELDNISVLKQHLRKLNEIADAVEEDETAQQRRELLKAVPEECSA